MEEFAEELPGQRLPDAVEAFFAQERSWWRLVRGTGVVTGEESTDQLRRWIEP
ncbi:hypothetical protein ABQF35_11100 [Mycobacterium syngnathidarum]